MKHVIVLAGTYNGYQNVLFMMDDDDFRLGSNNYRTVTTGRLTGQADVTADGRRFKCYKGADGKHYRVFADRSAEAMA